VLYARWEFLPLKQLAMYLRRIVIAERRCKTGEFPKHLLSRFRRRRLAVARQLVLLGGTVNPRMFTDPHRRGWRAGQPFWIANMPLRQCRPGVFFLVPIIKDMQ